MLALRFPNTYATPPNPITAKALLNEVGRRTADEVLFCDEDEDEDGALGAVDGILVHEDYSWMMPCYGLITSDAKGVVRHIKGLAHPWRPSVSKAPSGKFALAYVYQNWLSTVFNNAIRAIPMSYIEAIRSSIDDLYDLITQERLRNDAK